MSRKFKDLHKAALDAGYTHAESPANKTSSKGPSFHNYRHPDGHNMSVSVNRQDSPSGPFGASKKGEVNRFFHAPSHDGDTQSGTTVKDFTRLHSAATTKKESYSSPMATILEHIIDRNALGATEAIQKALKAKTRAALEEARKQVAVDVFGTVPEDRIALSIDEQIDQAYAQTLLEAPKVHADHVDHAMASELYHKALSNHDEAVKKGHGGNGNLDPWVKNYGKKMKGTKKSGHTPTFDDDKAVHGLTHLTKNHTLSSYLGKNHGQKVNYSTHHAAAKKLLPHVKNLIAGKDHRHGIDESFVYEAREPKKNTGMHSRITGHGFDYKGVKNGARQYSNAEGHEITHKFPTPNGNHSFHHTGPNGKTVKKGLNIGDTEIHQHLAQSFPKDARPKVTGPKGKLPESEDTKKPEVTTPAKKEKKYGNWDDTRMPWPKDYVQNGTGEGRSGSSMLSFKNHRMAEDEIEEGLGPVVNGKQKPITKFAGSWADQEAKRKAAAAKQKPEAASSLEKDQPTYRQRMGW